MDLSEFKNKKIHIVGVSGAEGSAVAEFLYENLNTKKIFAHDYCEKDDFKNSFNSFHDSYMLQEKEKLFRKIKNLPIEFNFGKNYLKGINKADIVFVPQSWFRYQINNKLVKLQKKIKFYNITKLYFKLCPCPIVAVTGTSGKSTTTRLIYEIIRNSQKQTYVTGNDRQNIQILDKIADIEKDNILVIEVSNRQLKIDLGKSPHIGVITNISPNHLDDHNNFQDYINTKKSLLKYQDDNDFSVLNYDNEITRKISDDYISEAFFFSRKNVLDKGCFIRNNEIIIKRDNQEYRICSIEDILLPGPHNVENVLAASMAAFLAGAGTKTIRETITSFKGLSSRLEFVEEINGVKYFEDSSACNPDGPKYAVQSFKSPIILIAGGSRKSTIADEFKEMAEEIIKNNVKTLLLIGEKAKGIEDAVRKAATEKGASRLLIKKCENLPEAVLNASTIAVPGDNVVLSPGCESFGMFKDYRDRGRQYKKFVKKLKFS